MWGMGNMFISANISIRVRAVANKKIPPSKAKVLKQISSFNYLLYHLRCEMLSHGAPRLTNGFENSN